MIDLLDEYPSITTLYARAKEAAEKGDERTAKKYQKAIRFLHNSTVPYKCEIGEGTEFGYGGIGCVVHRDTVIGKNCKIGSNVTIGGGSFGINAKNKRRQWVPHIGDNVYISTGAKLLGGIRIGNNVVIGANALVNRDVSDYSVMAGVPAKAINQVTEDNYKKYASFFGRRTWDELHSG